MRSLCAPLLFLFFLIFLSACRIHTTPAQPYTVGFEIVQAVDQSRIFKPNSASTDSLHYRPLDIDLWYPANPKAVHRALTFGDFLGLLEFRAAKYSGSDQWKGVTKQVAQSLCDAFKCSDTASLLHFRTQSFPDALPAEGKFPLILYLSSYNGMGYENIRLFEELAAKGFVVASISSIGRYPGDMTMKREDLMEQVNDAAFALKRLSVNPLVDSSRIGIVGYSWGGLAGVILASETPSAKCLVSLDGSEFHHYGEAPGEDSDFNNILYSHEFRNMGLTVPYLCLRSSRPNAAKKDSVYHFQEKIAGHPMILAIDSAGHEDFCYLPTIVAVTGTCRAGSRHNTITKLTEAFLEDHLLGTARFSSALAAMAAGEVHK